MPQCTPTQHKNKEKKYRWKKKGIIIFSFAKPNKRSKSAKSTDIFTNIYTKQRKVLTENHKVQNLAVKEQNGRPESSVFVSPTLSLSLV
jgi:hypothetical protein